MAPSSSSSLRSASRRPRGGFSLVELLVVVTVIIILVALLMPAFRHQREMSSRSVCLVRVSENGNLLMQMATDQNSVLPTDVNPSIGLPWLWDLTKNLRDRMMAAGTPRDAFYCPSNQYQNDDALWNWTTNYTVTGYYWIFKQTNSQPPLIGTDISYAKRYKPQGAGARGPGEVELVTDATISSGGDFTKVFGGWSKPHRTSHLIHTNPAGGNIFFRDGHGVWRDFADMQMRSPNPQQWF